MSGSEFPSAKASAEIVRPIAAASAVLRKTPVIRETTEAAAMVALLRTRLFRFVDLCAGEFCLRSRQWVGRAAPAVRFTLGHWADCLSWPGVAKD